MDGWERRVRRFMKRRHQGIAALKQHEAENYLVAAMREVDRLREDIALLTEDFQALCGEVGHVECECVIPCHMGCMRCDADTSGGSHAEA